MCRASSRAIQVGVARGRRASSKPRPPVAEAAFAPFPAIRATSGRGPRRRPAGKGADAKASSPRNRASRRRDAGPARFPARTRAPARGGPRRRPALFWRCCRHGRRGIPGWNGRAPDARRFPATHPRRIPPAHRPRPRTAPAAGCRAPQWAASHASPSCRSPVTVEKNGIVSACGARSARSASSCIGRRLHHRVVERMVHLHESREDALRLQLREHRFQRDPRAGESERARAVEGGDRHRAVMPRDERLGFLLAQTDGEHGAVAAGAVLHEPGPERDDARPFFQRKNARDTRRGDFAHAVADDRGGLNAPRFPKLRQRHLHREDRRLRDFGAVHLRVRFRRGRALPAAKSSRDRAWRRRSAR